MAAFTYQRIVVFKGVAKSFMEKNTKLTKLTYAIMKVMPQIDKAISKIANDANLRIEDKRVDLAEVDSKTQILLSEGNTYKYTREKAKELNAFIRENNDVSTSEVTIEPHIPKFDTSSLTIEELFAFEGIVIPTIEEPVDIDVVIPKSAHLAN